MTYGKEYKENDAKRISRHNNERLITELENLSNNGKNDTLEVQMCRIQKFRKHDGTIVCFDTDNERNITSTGIYHDELFEKDFIGIGFD